MQSSSVFRGVQNFCLFTGVAFAISAFTASTAHADLFKWFDEKFTFREEQRHLIAPSGENGVPPKHIIAPHYNDAESASWARYYQRQDLEPQYYLDSSSKVLRPEHGYPQPAVAKPVQQAAVQGNPQQAGYMYLYGVPPGYAAYPPGHGPGQLPPGYQAFVWRHYANQMQGMNSNLYIGEAGTTRENPLPNPTQVGRKVHVGDPVSSWSDGPADFPDHTFALPGDYNYQQSANAPTSMPMETRVEDSQLAVAGKLLEAPDIGMQMDDGGTIMANGMDALGQTTTQSLGQYSDQYRVQSGDTLSVISEKDQVYGDWKMWPLIYDANRNLVQDPDRLYPGWNLGIPRGYTLEEANSARQRASEKGMPIDLWDGR